MAKVEPHIHIDKIKEETINKEKVPLNTTFDVPYRNWQGKKAPEVFQVPLEYCKFRKENGRIKGEVLSYEKTQAELDPDDEESQKIISDFLFEKDKKQNDNLVKLIKAQGQRQPAVMTADGFLINGNRRKLALDRLYKESSQNEQYRFLKVVILPGSNDAERPTYQDIAKLENRYESQDDGKSDFTLMNKALTYISNERDLGIPLSVMLADDHTFDSKDPKKFKKATKDFIEDFIEPVKLMEQYLIENEIDGNYDHVKDRYASFQEASKIFSKLNDSDYLVKNGIEEDEVPDIKSAVFNIIKLREHSSIKERHNELVREIPKWFSNSKKDLIRAGKIDHVNQNKNITSTKEKDVAWQQNEANEVLDILKKCKNIYERKSDQLSAINRLEEIIQKLQKKELNYDQLGQMPIPDVQKGHELATKIQALSKELSSNFYDLVKLNKDKLKKK